MTLLLSGMLVLSSCVDDQTVGEGLLGTDKLEVDGVEKSTFEIEPEYKNKAIWNEISTIQLGTINDKQLGQTQASSAFQFRMNNSMKLYNPQIDSVKLTLSYKGVYGDADVEQKIRVYKLNGDLKDKDVLEDDFNITPLLGEEVGVESFRKKDISDTIYWKSKLDNSKDSLLNGKKVVKSKVNSLTIKLDKDKIGNFILNAPSGTFTSSESFIDFFKGLYIATDLLPDNEKGALYGFDVYGTNLELYYRNGRAEGNEIDTISTVFRVTDNSVRINNALFKRDNATAYSNPNYICLMGLGGMKAKIDIPNLNTWVDSVDYAINKAEITFKVVPNMGNDNDKKLPQCLSLSFVDSEDNNYSLNSFSVGSVSTVNGLLNSEDSTYTFLIPNVLQDIVKGDTKIKHFELTTAELGMKNTVNNYGNTSYSLYTVTERDIANRVMLYREGEHKPKITVVYTKN